MPISEDHQEEDDEIESVITDTHEEFTQPTCQLQNTSNINEEPETEVQNHLTGTMENTFRSPAASLATTFVCEERQVC